MSRNISKWGIMSIDMVTPREGRVSRNCNNLRNAIFQNRSGVTPREGRVSRNFLALRAAIRRFKVTPREGRVSRNF